MENKRKKPVFNEITSIISVAFGLLLVFGHAVAFVLGLFESSIQSLRLHYVEFFSKFYHGGGIDFSPLRKPAAKKNGLLPVSAGGKLMEV